MKSWLEDDYPGLQRMYDNAANIPEDIDRMCEEIFASNHKFGVFARPEPSTEGKDIYIPCGIPSEVKAVVYGMVDEVCKNTKYKKRTADVKKKSTPKKQPAQKVTLGEEFAKNVTMTVNKLDDRLTVVSDELRAEVLTNVHDGLTRATQEIRTNMVSQVNDMLNPGTESS